MDKAKEVFQAINKKASNKEIIAAQIEESILKKEYLPGSKLPAESELGKIFGVSRTSVREAMQILNMHGLVSIEKGRGIFVRNPSSKVLSNSILKFLEHRIEGDFTLDLIHARQIIEPEIAYLAALNRTEDDVEKMKIDIENIANNEDMEKHSEYDMSFHMHLAYASKNKIIPLFLKPLHELMPIVKSKILLNVKDAKGAAIIWHTKIFEAVKERNPESAKEMMTAHLKIAAEHATEALLVSAKNN